MIFWYKFDAQGLPLPAIQGSVYAVLPSGAGGLILGFFYTMGEGAWDPGRTCVSLFPTFG